ncbi:MAG: hypothetical protein JXR46_05985 [Calditrichaceae bacterium]|nr:hypothetical protein [Calditrichaceae bacterium]MBN2708575.1 hypothetical protein [Calditrichaceae bacterium]RQV96884.1 MAG: hypothetical protein EH224_03250 [Calditrichota bacterium]
MKLKFTKIKKAFEDFNIITSNDLFNFYKSIDPAVKKTTVNWRIYKLVQSGKIQRIGRGKYIIGKENKYIPDISSKEIKISNLLKKEFPFIKYCLWSTAVLNEFTRHLSAFQFIVVEVEKDTLEPVYFMLKDNYNSTFKKPAREIVEDFISNRPDSIIVNTFISEAPVQNIKEIPTSTLEKLLVDIYCDQNLLYFLKGNELFNIYKNAFDKYTVNQSRLLRYADRRRKKKQIEAFIKTIIRR